MLAPSPPHSRRLGRVVALLELVRMANLPTALADVWLGAALVRGTLAPTWPVVLLSLASACFYCGGMVQNDVHDAPVDRRERPERPIPSGRVSESLAARLASGLLLGGLMLTGVAALFGCWGAPLVGIGLLLAIHAYNTWLKATALAPVAMGCCRVGNLLLGVAVPGDATRPFPMLAIAIASTGTFAYIAGVTWYARGEAQSGRRHRLASAAAAMVGPAVWALGPVLTSTRLAAAPTVWLLAWGVAALLVLRRLVIAAVRDEPRRIGAAIGNAILSLILFDALLCLGLATPPAACTILLLMPIAMLLRLRFAMS